MEKIVLREVPKYVDRPIEVVKIIEIPNEIVIEKIVIVDKEVEVLSYKINEIEKTVEVEVYVDRIKEVEKIVERPVEIVTEKIVFVDKIVEKSVDRIVI